ncbi:MAG: glycosyltransferase family 39 protein [Opitutaceae bacterium]
MPASSPRPTLPTTVSAWPAPLERRTFWSTWGPVLLALLVGIAFHGTRGLTETSETRYAECAREMLVTGDWLEPQLEFLPHWTKPPVAYWCMAAGMKIFGVNAWGARLPGVLALLVATWTVTAMGRRLWGARAGFAGGAAFALGFPVFGAWVVTTDIYLTAAETLAGAAFLLAATEADASKRLRFVGAMWAAWGLAFLIKGPPALLPLLAIIPWNLLQLRARRVPLAHPLGLLCFAAMALPWYIAMLVRHPNLLDYYIGTEIVGRVSTDMGHNRAWYKAIEIYAPALLGACGAFGLWAANVALTRGGWARTERWRELWRVRDARLLLVAWVVLPMIVFCLSRSKLHLYVLPLVAPLALIVGRVLAARVSWRAFRNVALGSALVFVAIKGVAGHLSSRRDMAALSAEIRADLAALPAGIPIVFWDEPTIHGVTFYLGLDRDTLPERIANDEKAKFETWTPTEFAARVRAGSYERGALLVTDPRKRAELAKAMPGLPIAAERSGRYWALLRLAGK